MPELRAPTLTEDTPKALKEALNSFFKLLVGAVNTNRGIGFIERFAGLIIPEGWVMCDGTVYPNKLYPDAAKIISTTFGGTPGTSFKVPTIIDPTTGVTAIIRVL